MTKDKITSLLYTVYVAGVRQGAYEGHFVKHDTLEAFGRLIIGESPMQDNVSYAIKEKVEELMRCAEGAVTDAILNPHYDDEGNLDGGWVLEGGKIIGHIDPNGKKGEPGMPGYFNKQNKDERE